MRHHHGRFRRNYKHEFFLYRKPKAQEEVRKMVAKRLGYYNCEGAHSSQNNKSSLQYKKESPTRWSGKSQIKWIDIRERRVI